MESSSHSVNQYIVETNTLFTLLAAWSSVALSTLAFKDIKSKVNACSSIAARIA